MGSRITRRQSMGALIGGAASAPEVFRNVAAGVAAQSSQGGLMGLRLSGERAAGSNDDYDDYIADLKRIASGDVTLSDMMRWGAGTVCADDQQMAALKSVSPMVKHVLVYDRQNSRAREACMREALESLMRIGKT